MQRVRFSTTVSNGGNGNSHRDARGRFVVGNPGGPGNPHAKSMHQFRLEFSSCFTLDDVRGIAQRLKAKALSGDLKAIEMVLNRLTGPVTEIFGVEGAIIIAPDARYD
jgi:hypothetical protein